MAAWKSIKFKLNSGKARGRHLQAVQCVDVRVAVEVISDHRDIAYAIVVGSCRGIV